MSETPPPSGEPQQPPYGQPQQPYAYGGPPHGQPQQPPYGQPSQPYAYGGPPHVYYLQDHPQAMLALILGIVGVVVCGVAAPFAWVIGNRAVAEIDASNGRYGGRSTANAGRILGIVGSVLLGLAILAIVAVLVLVVVGLTTSTT